MPSSKVQNVELDDPAGGETAIGSAEPEVATAKGKPSSWEVGQAAPKSMYLTQDGEVTDSEPERGKVLVVEGDVVTRSIAGVLAEKK